MSRAGGCLGLGPDRLIRDNAPALVIPLIHLFNLLLASSRFPSSLKRSIGVNISGGILIQGFREDRRGKTPLQYGGGHMGVESFSLRVCPVSEGPGILALPCDFALAHLRQLRGFLPKNSKVLASEAGMVSAESLS